MNLRLKFHSADDPQPLIESPDWLMGVKIDGHGVWAGYQDGIPVVLNADGAVIGKSISPGIWTCLDRLYHANKDNDFLLRGELDRGKGKFVDATLRVWDIYAPGIRFFKRNAATWILCSNAGLREVNSINMHQFYISPDVKQSKFDEALRDEREGVVFYHQDSMQQFGKRVRDVLKWKFKDTADVIVHDVRVTTLRDVNGYAHGVATMYARDEYGDLVCVGDVHLRDKMLSDLLSKQYPLPILEVEYLYWDGSLVQPIAKRIRRDKDTVTTVDELRKRGV